MFRLIRLPILLGIAFVTGVFYERNAAREVCEAAGGTKERALCIGASK